MIRHVVLGKGGPRGRDGKDYIGGRSEEDFVSG